MSYKDIKSFEQECKEKDAENGRLKIELETEKKTADKFLHDLQTQTRLAGNYMAKLFTAQALITELCDTLESACLELSWDAWPEIEKQRLALIQSAREAAR